MKLLDRWRESPSDLRVFLAGILFLGINGGILQSTFNNYLHDRFDLDATARGFLELPREFPGFLLIVVTGLLAFLPMRFWAVGVGICSAVGVMGLGFLSPSLTVMSVWMILWSLADHLFMPVENTLGLKLAGGRGFGRRLGQLAGARNLAMILGTGVVGLVMHFGLGNYGTLYVIAAAAALLASFTFLRMRPPEVDTQKAPPLRFVFRREYSLYYLLNVLFGARKQIFLTFGPWVLVSVFGTSPETIAMLLLLSSALGVLFRQVFGELTDRLGERAMLVFDALTMLLICAGFALSSWLWLLYALYVFDNLMFAARIARTTYLNRIVLDQREIGPTVSLGVTLDHVVSMSVPFLGGLLWSSRGYPAVFWVGALIALANIGAALKIGARPASTTS